MGTRETKPLIPTSIYAITKRDHEELCLVTGAAYGIPAVALRFFNVYGPGQALSNPYTGVAAIFASRLLNGRPPVIFEDGEQSRDFIHVSDIVRAIMLALESERAAGHAINLGTGRPSTVVQIAEALSAGLDADIEPIRNGQYRAGDIRHCVADPQRARELLGFEATTTLEDGMRDLLDWLSNQEAVDRVDDATRELAVARFGSLSRSSEPHRGCKIGQSWPTWRSLSSPPTRRTGWSAACRPSSSHAGERRARRDRGRQLLDRRHARARGVALPAGARGQLPQPGLCLRQQPRA